MTRVGGIDLSGAVAGSVALGEVVIHGWDIARSTGREYQVDDEVARAVRDHLVGFAGKARCRDCSGPRSASPRTHPHWSRRSG